MSDGLQLCSRCGAWQADASSQQSAAARAHLRVASLRVCSIRRRYVEHRELAAKIVCLLYNTFNALVAFPRVLAGMAPGTGLCSAAWVLRYCNAQPLLTSNVVSMVILCCAPAPPCCRDVARWLLPMSACCCSSCSAVSLDLLWDLSGSLFCVPLLQCVGH